MLLLFTAGRVTAGRNAELGAQIAARQPAGSAIFVQADVLHEADIKRVVDTAVEKWGRLDILFANAGGPSLPPTERATDSSTRAISGVAVLESAQNRYFGFLISSMKVISSAHGCGR